MAVEPNLKNPHRPRQLLSVQDMSRIPLQELDQIFRVLHGNLLLESFLRLRPIESPSCFNRLDVLKHPLAVSVELA